MIEKIFGTITLKFSVDEQGNLLGVGIKKTGKIKEKNVMVSERNLQEGKKFTEKEIFAVDVICFRK